MKKTYGFLAMMTAFALGSAAPATADVVAAPDSTLEILNVTGQWLDTTDGTDVSGIGSDTVRWGIPANDDDAKSGYRFGGVKNSRPYQPETNFRLGTFTHLNETIQANTSITAAQLRVSFSVRVVNIRDNISRVVRAFSTFDFRHLETPNNDPVCADGKPNNTGANINGCADRVTLVFNPEFSDSFRLGEAVYTLDITGFNIASPFWTTEDATTSRSLFGRFTTSPDLVGGGGGGPAPVPLPAAGWLLIAGLSGLAGVSRFRRRVA